MPTYIFKNKKTGIVYEDFMSITDMEKILSNPHMELVIDSVTLYHKLAIILMLRLMMVGKKHLLRFQKHTHLVPSTNNTVRPVSQT